MPPPPCHPGETFRFRTKLILSEVEGWACAKRV